MGFKSEIYIKIEKEKIFEVKNLLTILEETYSIDIKEEEKFHTDDNYIYIYLSDWKFYTGYPEIKLIINTIENMEEHAGMIAINEDNTIDNWGYPWEVDLYVSINIEGFKTT